MDLSDISTEKLMAEVKRRLDCQSKPEKRIVLVGPPGSGKGTQSPKIKNEHCLCHLATGDMLRAAVQAKTPLGMKAKRAMESGALVTDDLVVGIISDAIQQPECRNGFILDGFPRTESQAHMLDDMLATKGQKIDKVLDFNVPDSVLVERVCGRWIHAGSGRSYHEKFAPPKVSGIDDVTGEALTQRKDDNADTLKTRLAAYHAQTTPVLKYYRDRVATIRANRPMGEVEAQIKSALS